MISINRRAGRILGAGSAAAVIALLCWTTGMGSETTRADFARQVSNLGEAAGRMYAAPPPVPAVVDTYDKGTPPSTGCEAVVSDLQRRIIEAYAPVFEGIRHINMFGYLGEWVPRRGGEGGGCLRAVRGWDG